MLLEREAVDVVDAVGRLAALQAQEARPPFIALWSRVEGFDARSLIDALAAKTIVRGTLMRGTVHLARAQDFLRWRPVLAPLGVEGLRKVVGARLDGADIDAALAGVRELFEGSAELSADDVRDWIAKHRPSDDTRAVARISLYSLPRARAGRRALGLHAEVAVHGLRHWLGRDPRRDPSSLIRSYLAAFGPATVRTLSRSSAAGTSGRVRRSSSWALRLLHDLPDAATDADVDAPVRFLPDFDSLMLAHADRSRVIARTPIASASPPRTCACGPSCSSTGWSPGSGTRGQEGRDRAGAQAAQAREQARSTTQGRRGWPRSLARSRARKRHRASAPTASVGDRAARPRPGVRAPRTRPGSMASRVKPTVSCDAGQRLLVNASNGSAQELIFATLDACASRAPRRSRRAGPRSGPRRRARRSRSRSRVEDRTRAASASASSTPTPAASSSAGTTTASATSRRTRA
jgi:hypothetical protein